MAPPPVTPPSLRACANCGAPEGTVPGVAVHRPCGRCKITRYCSVQCQEQHWKNGGHNKNCLKPEERRASPGPEGRGRTGSSSKQGDGGRNKKKRRSGEKPKGATAAPSSVAPDRSEKMFEDALMIFDWIQTRVQQSENGPWVPLSHRQQEQMFKVVRLWEGCSKKSWRVRL